MKYVSRQDLERMENLLLRVINRANSAANRTVDIEQDADAALDFVYRLMGKLEGDDGQGS